MRMCHNCGTSSLHKTLPNTALETQNFASLLVIWWLLNKNYIEITIMKYHYLYRKRLMVLLGVFSKGSAIISTLAILL